LLYDSAILWHQPPSGQEARLTTVIETPSKKNIEIPPLIEFSPQDGSRMGSRWMDRAMPSLLSDGSFLQVSHDTGLFHDLI
jgi:hypothetical protein